MHITIVIEAYQMAGEDDPGAVANEVLDGWDGGADAGVIGDVLAVVEGNVEVGAHEHAFPLEVRCGEIAHVRSSWSSSPRRAFHARSMTQSGSAKQRGSPAAGRRQPSGNRSPATAPAGMRWRGPLGVTSPRGRLNSRAGGLLGEPGEKRPALTPTPLTRPWQA